MSNRNHIERKPENGKLKKIRIAAAVAVPVLLLAFFYCNRALFMDTAGDGSSVWAAKEVAVYFALFAVTELSLLWQPKLPDRAHTFLKAALLVIAPVLDFVFVEYAINSGFTYSGAGLYKCVMNVAWYMTLQMIFFTITMSEKVGALLGAVTGAIFATVNVYMMAFAGMPLYATDLTAAQTAGNVLGNYKLFLTRGLVLMIAYLIMMLVLAFRFSKGKKNPGLLRIFLIPVSLCLALAMGHYTIHAHRLQKQQVKISAFRPIKSYRGNGALLTFARSFMLLEVEKPEGYSTAAVDEILAPYESDQVSGEQESKQPNVIVIMDEAFADMQAVGNLETNEDPIPFWHSLTENTVKGFSYVSVWGGHTANTEYEFLSGDSMAFIPKRTTPFLQYIKHPFKNLTTSLIDQDYQGLLAMHPYLPTGYNRERTYAQMQFADFLSIEDFPDAKLVRRFVSDEADFERIISEYEASKQTSDAPFYMFNVTMQNHSEYNEDFDNLPLPVQITSPQISEEAKMQATRYLNLTRLTDEALQMLIEYFDSKDDPTIIVMFGDHQPGLGDEFYDAILGADKSELSVEDSMVTFKVPFMIHANFDIEEQDNVLTSMNYLHNRVQQIGGLKSTGYDKYLMELEKTIPQINMYGYYDAEGKFYEVGDETSPYYELINQYHILNYNHLFDYENTSGKFALKQ